MGNSNSIGACSFQAFLELMDIWLARTSFVVTHCRAQTKSHEYSDDSRDDALQPNTLQPRFEIASGHTTSCAMIQAT